MRISSSSFCCRGNIFLCGSPPSLHTEMIFRCRVWLWSWTKRLAVRVRRTWSLIWVVVMLMSLIVALRVYFKLKPLVKIPGFGDGGLNLEELQFRRKHKDDISWSPRYIGG